MKSRLAIASLAAAMGTGFAMAQAAEPQSLVQINESRAGIDVTVVDESGAGIRDAQIWIRSGILKEPITGNTNEKGSGNSAVSNLPHTSSSFLPQDTHPARRMSPSPIGL